MRTSVSAEDFKAAMGSFASGVTVVATVDGDGQPFGLTATAFSSVSKAPPLCLVCVSLDAEAHPVIRATGRFTVNLLTREQEWISTRFATHGLPKFEGIDWVRGEATGTPILADALAAIECEVTTTIPAGDHDVFIGAIRRITLGSGEPLVHLRGQYRDLRAF